MRKTKKAPAQESIGFRRRREKRERIAAFLAGNPMLVGIDLAKGKHAVWLADSNCVPSERMMIPHSRIVSPLVVNREREIEHLTYAKGDYRDAELITQIGARGQWLDLTLERDPNWRMLRALSLTHEDLLQGRTAERLRIRSLLELALPEFLSYFKDPLRDTARALLKRLSRPASDIPKTYDELLTRSAAVRGHRLRRNKIRAWLAWLEVSRSFGVESALASSLSRIGLAIDRYELLDDQLAEVTKQLVALYETIPYSTVLDTIPGVSRASHALLLGFIGDPLNYDRGTCLAKVAGIEPRENQSGNSEGSHSISRRGSSSLRHLLYRIVMGFRKGNGEFFIYIQHVRSREKNPLDWHQAAVAAANKYLRLIHRMCVTGEPYDHSKLMSRT
jgi:transposase